MEKSLTKAYAILAYERMQVNEDLNIALAEMRSQCDQIISNLKTAINEGLGKYIFIPSHTTISPLIKLTTNFHFIHY